MASTTEDRTIELHRHVSQLLRRNANGILWSAVLQWSLFVLGGYNLVALDVRSAGVVSLRSASMELIYFWILVLVFSGIAIHVFQAACHSWVQALTRMLESLTARIARDEAWPTSSAFPSIGPTSIAWTSCVVLLFIQILLPAGILLSRAVSPEAGVPILALVTLALVLFLYFVRRTVSGNVRAWRDYLAIHELLPEAS